MKLKFQVTGMTCAACSARVEKVAKAVSGVEDVEVNLLAGSMVVTAGNEGVAEPVMQAVRDAGYGAEVFGAERKQIVAKDTAIPEMKRRIVISAVFLAVLMYFTMGHMAGLPMPGWYHGEKNAVVAALIQLLLTLPVVYLNRSYYSRGIKSLWQRSPNMDSLIAVGSGAALIYGITALLRMAYAIGHSEWETVAFYRENLYFESAAMILTLITLGKFLEARAKGKTGDAIRQLMDLRPQTATIRRAGKEQEVGVEEVRVGDLVIVRTGSRIPVDGIVLHGRAYVDQSALTGESVPVEKTDGDTVSAATSVSTGYLEFRAEKVGEDTTLAQIIRMVEEAGGSKAPVARLADKIAGIFVPVVMTIAAVAFLVWMLAGRGMEFSLSAAISVLVISCPCALGLATPVAIMVGTGRAAGLGVLFKNAAALEMLHRVNTVVLDKTGTLTTGKPRVTDIMPNGIREDELLAVAVALEEKSEHPFARAILERAGKGSCATTEDYETLPGRGVTAVWNGVRYYGGNARLMQERGILVPEYPEMSEQGKTPLYFASETQYLGAIAAADVLKEDSSDAVQTLKKLGLEVVMLTGDNEKTAKAVAANAGISQVIADVLPGDKAGAIQKLQNEGRRVAMVGDGINDAPALVTADVGIAIGGGTDVAVESADVVLMSGSLSGICKAVELSKATMKTIRQNLFWAFFYNCMGIPVAFSGMLSPMIGAAAMSFSSVFVVTNALRLRLFQPKCRQGQTEMAELEDMKMIEEEKTMETVIRVEGMMCPHCKAMVEKVCKAVPGTVDAVVDLQKKCVTVTGDAPVEAWKKAIADAGYEVVEQE